MRIGGFSAGRDTAGPLARRAHRGGGATHARPCLSHHPSSIPWLPGPRLPPLLCSITFHCPHHLAHLAPILRFCADGNLGGGRGTLFSLLDFVIKKLTRKLDRPQMARQLEVKQNDTLYFTHMVKIPPE